MTNLRLIPDSPAAPGTVREVIAWAIDDWLERTAHTDNSGAAWSSADIAERVLHCLERSGYRVVAPGPGDAS